MKTGLPSLGYGRRWTHEGRGVDGKVSAGLWMQPRLPLEGETPNQTLRFRKPGSSSVFSSFLPKPEEFTSSAKLLGMCLYG